MNAVQGKVQVKFEAAGVAAIAKASRQVSSGVSSSMGKVGDASRQIASGIEQIARAGSVSGDALKGILTSASSIAFAFGPAGAIAGAFAITGQAIFEHLTKPLKDAADQALRAGQEIARLANAGQSAQLQEKYRTLLQGQAFDETTGKPNAVGRVPGSFAGSLLDMRAHLAELQQVKETSPFWAVDTKFLKDWKDLNAQLEIAEAKAKRFEQAILNIQNQPAPTDAGTLPASVTTAARIAAPAKPASSKEKSRNQLFDRLPLPKDLTQTDALSDLLNDAGLKAAQVVPTATQQWTDEALKGITTMAEQVQGALAAGLGDAISAGFDAAFSGGGIGGAIKGLASSALKTLGGVVKQIGTHYLATAQLLSFVQKTLFKNPTLAIPAAIGLIALGSALQSAGNGISGGSGGGGGASYSAAPTGSYGGGSSAPIVLSPAIDTRGVAALRSSTPLAPAAARVVTPVASRTVSDVATITPRTPVENHFTIIGPNDPAAQRAIADIIDRTTRRST